jgi:hypothetical protein
LITAYNYFKYRYIGKLRSEGRTTLGRPRSRGDDDIKMDLQEVGWRNMNWIDLAQN